MPDDNNIDIISPDAGGDPAESDEQQGEPSAPEEEAQEQEQEGDDGNEPEGEPKPKESAVQKRINEITRARREAETEAATLRKLLIEQRQAQDQQSKPVEPQAPQAPVPPKQEDFQDFAAYQEAMLDHRVEVKLFQRDQQSRQQAEAQQRQTSQAQAAQESQQRAAKMIEAGRGKFDDFDVVALDPNVPLTAAMAEAISLEDSVGPDVAYYLGKRPEEAKRIASLPPAKQLMEIGRLAERITAAGKKNITKAPPPIKPTGGRTKVVVDESKLSDAEWLRRQEAKKRSGK